MASGWMTIRGIRRRRGFDRGFVVSDHADFPGLLEVIEASRARRVLVTHGATEALARLLRERGLDAGTLPTRFMGEAVPDRRSAAADANDDAAEPEDDDGADNDDRGHDLDDDGADDAESAP